MKELAIQLSIISLSLIALIGIPFFLFRLIVRSAFKNTEVNTAGKTGILESGAISYTDPSQALLDRAAHNNSLGIPIIISTFLLMFPNAMMLDDPTVSPIHSIARVIILLLVTAPIWVSLSWLISKATKRPKLSFFFSWIPYFFILLQILLLSLGFFL